jgi:hypothetical protein
MNNFAAMPKFLTLLSCLLLSACTCFGQSQDTLRTGYSDSVKNVLTHIARIKDPQKIEYCIPTTKAESRRYFAFDLDKELSPAFKELQKKLVRYSIAGNTRLLKKYLYYSEFVEGYFIDDYVVNIEKIARSNIVSFCNVISDCDPGRIKNLSEIKTEYCK